MEFEELNQLLPADIKVKQQEFLDYVDLGPRVEIMHDHEMFWQFSVNSVIVQAWGDEGRSHPYLHWRGGTRSERAVVAFMVETGTKEFDGPKDLFWGSMMDAVEIYAVERIWDDIRTCETREIAQ